jgi:hypothetical protein
VALRQADLCRTLAHEAWHAARLPSVYVDYWVEEALAETLARRDHRELHALLPACERPIDLVGADADSRFGSRLREVAWLERLATASGLESGSLAEAVIQHETPNVALLAAFLHQDIACLSDPDIYAEPLVERVWRTHGPLCLGDDPAGLRERLIAG